MICGIAARKSQVTGMEHGVTVYEQKEKCKESGGSDVKL
jgi:hypothetical protein